MKGKWLHNLSGFYNKECDDIKKKVILCLATGLFFSFLSSITCTTTVRKTDVPVLTYRLQVYVSGEGEVELDPPGIDFPVGTVVTLHAYPKAGYRLRHIIYNMEKVSSPVLKIKMNTDKMVVVNFIKD